MWCSSGAEIEQRLGQSQVSRALGHGDPLVGRGETDPVQLAVHLGQDVGPAEGGPAFGHALHRHAGCVGQDAIGQVAGVQKRKIVAVRQSRDPRDLVVADVALGPPAPAPGHLGQAVVFLGRPGLERRPAPQVEDLRTGRLAAIRGDELADQRLSCAPRWRPSAGRTRPSGPRAPRSLRNGAARSGGEPDRPSPTPTPRSTGR